MSTNSIDDTPPLSRLSALILSPSYLSLVVDGSGRKEGSKVSRHIYQCSDDVFPHVYSHWQVPLISSPSAETIPDRRENASHGCQGSSVIYNRDPVQSDVQDAPFEPRQGQYDPDSPWPDASQDLEFPLNDPQNPALYLTKDPLTTESAILSLAPGVCSPPLSESSGAAFIPEGRQISGSDASKSPIVIPVPSCRSREDLQDRGAWTPTVSQVETIGYRANELETVFYYGPQESSLQVSYGPHYILPVPVPEPYYFGAMKPNLSSSQSPSVYASNNYAVSPPTQAVPHFQSRASNTKEKPDKKYFCPRCESGFTLPQMLSRHIKDMHEAKETCSHSSCSFTFSRGRPYIYQKHIEKKHHGLDPEVPPPPEVRQKGSRYAKESSKPYAMGARKPQRAIYVPPATRDPVASPHDVPYCSWATK